MDCTICHKPIVLIPSAQERAIRFGGTSESYTRLFTNHPTCFLAKDKQATIDLIRSLIRTGKVVFLNAPQPSLCDPVSPHPGLPPN